MILTIENIMTEAQKRNFGSLTESKVESYLKLLPMRVMLHMSVYEAVSYCQNVFESEREVFLRATR